MKKCDQSTISGTKVEEVLGMVGNEGGGNGFPWRGEGKRVGVGGVAEGVSGGRVVVTTQGEVVG